MQIYAPLSLGAEFFSLSYLKLIFGPMFTMRNSIFGEISFPMAVFETFGDETDINLPAESIGKVILSSDNTLQR